ncbi:MAG: TolC family protein, partial [Acidobacteriota bacterium]|nr:TolC family protein [Acidobacteriota bacterium]
MFRQAVLLLLAAACAGAETHPMTLRQAVTRAVEQNPDVALARLDEEMARLAVRVQRDPFSPRITMGSGLAYSNGFPMSVEGSAPSIVQANAQQFLFNRPQSYAVAQSKENARGAAMGVTEKRGEVAFRAASLYLDAERGGRAAELARKDADSLEKVLDAVRARAAEGRALPLEEKQAALAVARARQTAENLEEDASAAETSLALVIGYGADDRVRPVAETRPAPELAELGEGTIRAALDRNAGLRQLQSQIAAKGLEMRSERAARLPRADLVAEYAILARFNNYDEFFRRFQRNNGQVGVSLQLPLLPGPGVGAQIAQTRADTDRLRTEVASARNRVISEIQQAFRDVKKAQTATGVARLDLEVAEEQLA